MESLIFLGQNININNIDFKDKYIIGVDKGAYLLASNNINIDLSIGDFDSIDNNMFNIIKSKSKDIIILNPIKDTTDTKEALKYAYKISKKVTILGGISGNRIEHFLANISLFIDYPNLKIKDDNSLIFKLDNDYTLYKNEYKYISLFALSDSIISLNGFKYNLNNYNLKIFDSLCISNEIIDIGNLKIKGSILVILSNEDNLK